MNKTVVWWQVALFTFLLNIVTGLVILGFTRNATGSDKTKEEIRLKADKSYVDYQDSRLEYQIEKKADKEVVEMMKDDIKDTKENTRLILKMLNDNRK